MVQTSRIPFAWVTPGTWSEHEIVNEAFFEMTNVEWSTKIRRIERKDSSFGASRRRIVESRRDGIVRSFRIQASATNPAYVPDMNKRKMMNGILITAVGAPTVAILGPYLSVLVPKRDASGNGGVIARDEIGAEVTLSSWLSKHPTGDRSLVQGLKGDPTYLIVQEDDTLQNYGINAICTHLGCVVPWNKAENKFMCPCHGSQYNPEGTVIRGPAPLPLALAHLEVGTDEKVTLTEWKETDFRNGSKPWW